MTQLPYKLYRWVWTSLDWIFPPDCGGCKKPGFRWCDECQQSVQVIRPPICTHCGRSLPVQGVCPSCREAPPEFAALRSWGVYGGPLREALHCLKYEGNIPLGEILARNLIDMIAPLHWDIDLVTPVPQSLARKSERGYNQAALLAKPVALALEWQYYPQAIKKVRDNRSQVGLNWDQRWENVSGAFEANPKFVNHKRVLVVDDITTSGATVSHCAQALLKAGADVVYAITLARASST